MMRINWKEIEKKWQSQWIENKDFQSDPDTLPKKLITVAYPYPNSPQHIGHGRTYTLADVHARFYRMQGYNVLFPMAFHYTGTPILGMAKRVQAGESEIIDNLKNIYGVNEQSIKEFVEPIKIAEYFHKEIKTGMIEMGYSIDWRREFTTIDPVYSKFIQWQISILREKNLIIQGSHPVGWCPADQNPVSQHDTLGDVEPDFTEYVLIKFKFDDWIIPTATLRPETIFGVVHLWVNPEITYEKITVDGQKWIVSKECAYKLEFQDKKITYEGKVQGQELIGKLVTIAHTNQSIPIFPASFVKSNTGTGIVMSVPAHAPFDYQALEDLKKSRLDSELAAQVNKAIPISIIETSGYGENPAKQIVEKFAIKNQNDPKLEDATKEIYAKEFYEGKLKSNTAEFSGIKVAYAKDPVKEWLTSKKYADIFLELTDEDTKCRCGCRCVVKILNNQWFLNYGDESWKQSATRCFGMMNILPQEIRAEFNYVVGWLRERACARQHGLGTKLPWDENWIVESLSDSVIYMAYYSLSKFVNSGVLSSENTNKAFFDYVFLGKGDYKKISEITKIPIDTLAEIKKEFEYFYPVDSRHSGRDLVPNHLTFFVLNHTAIFPEKYWPKEIVVNGSVLMNGSKMSKSMGNIIPLRNAIKEYGADPIRLAIIISAELLQDADFNIESVSGIQSKLESLYNQCVTLDAKKITNQNAEDVWFLSKIQHVGLQVTAAIKKMRLREALHDILFSIDSDLGWYLKRTSAKNRKDVSAILHHVITIRVAMLLPFAPHIAEEMWEKLGHSEFVSKSKWPEFSQNNIDTISMQSEELLKSLIRDIAHIIKVAKISPKKIFVYTASSFKCKIYHSVLEQINSGQTNMGAIMKNLIANSDTSDVKKMPDFVQKTIKDILSDTTQIREMRLKSKEFDEKGFVANELLQLANKEFDSEIQVFSESDPNIYDPDSKAKHARPFKPAIFIQ